MIHFPCALILLCSRRTSLTHRDNVFESLMLLHLNLYNNNTVVNLTLNALYLLLLLYKCNMLDNFGIILSMYYSIYFFNFYCKIRI